MKDIAIFLMMVCLACSGFAADEIHFDYESGATVYAVRFQTDGKVFFTNGSGSEDWTTVGNYVVTMTENGSGGHFVGSFDTVPNIAAGTYKVTAYEQLGGAPADSDRAIYVGEIVWTGTAEYVPNDVLDAIVEDTGTTIPGKIDTTDALITSSHSTTDGKIDTTDALITSSHSTTDGLITTVDTVVDAIKAVTDLLPDGGALSSLATLANQTWMINVAEGDTWTNTATTPWRMEIRTKGTASALIEKEIREIDGDDVVAEFQRIGQLTEPVP